ncbi:MAG: hypothetical protein KatS3mg107_0230 [Gemmataceae bacterium]|nr:MAG: hypothetical protein KatS3mg107_0230 [Gemmataceae bacterium]
MLATPQRLVQAATHLALVGTLGAILLSCGPRDQVDEPLPTDGPNQVVLKVPRMT